MEAILKFNLPEEDEDHMNALNGWKYRSVIHETMERIRQDLKYKELPEEVQTYAEGLREFITDQLADSTLPR